MSTYATTCDALYYGLGGAADPMAAYRCYEKDGNSQMQIVLALNGDGVRRSVRRVQKLFDEWERKDPGDALSGQSDPLRVAFGSLRAGAPVKRLVFCHDIASSTLDSMRCDSIRQFKLRAQAKLTLDRTASRLIGDQAAAFTRLRAAWDRFYDAEGDRGTQAFVQGSIRNTAGAHQQDYVQAHFFSHVMDVVGHLTLESSTGARLAAAMDGLAEVYRKDLIEHEEGEKDASGTGAGYREVTTVAKQAWEDYRDAWVAMATTLKIPNMAPTDAARAIETLLAVERAEELKHNILGVH